MSSGFRFYVWMIQVMSSVIGCKNRLNQVMSSVIGCKNRLNQVMSSVIGCKNRFNQVMSFATALFNHTTFDLV
jgi:hypothetical protein